MREKSSTQEDMGAALAGAYAEKPLRDAAREEGVTSEERNVLDGVAERRADKAIQEYKAEKEKSPVEQLRAKMGNIATEMRGKGVRSRCSYC